MTVSRFEFERIDLAIASLMANQRVESESERALDQCQNAAVTLPVNLSFSFRYLESQDIYLSLLLRTANSEYNCLSHSGFQTS